jgi:hypothetical protein
MRKIKPRGLVSRFNFKTKIDLVHVNIQQEEKPREKCVLKKSPRVKVLLPITFCSYPKGGTFTTKLDLKNECLINHKVVFETRNPAFWVGAVSGSCFFYCPSHLFIV